MKQGNNMIDVDKIRNFVASISNVDLDNEQLIEKSNHFFAENCSEIDAEFINRLMMRNNIILITQ
jgi:alpha/beta superfamily hydrolase